MNFHFAHRPTLVLREVDVRRIETGRHPIAK